MTEQDLLYAAATIDCEGTIVLIKHSLQHGKGGVSWYYLHVAVTMTTPQVPEWMQNTFGGSLKEYGPYQPNHKKRYSWYMDSHKARQFLGLVLPYLKVKTKQAQLALVFQDSRRSKQGVKTSLAERNRQEGLRNKMQILNK